MTTFFIKKCILITGLFISVVLHGQDNVTVYFEPDISISYKASDKFSHDFKLSNRTYLYEDTIEFKALQMDISYFLKLKLNPDNGLGLGMQYRFREIFENSMENELRITEQYTGNIRMGNKKLGNRFRAEQRISPSLTTHRFRYRLAMGFPLHGTKIDVGEAYIVFSTESLLSVARGMKPAYDQRLTTHVGWLLNSTTKLQVGTEYRAENYTQQIENVFFLFTSLILSL